MNAYKAAPSFYSHSYSLSDSNGDGYNDEVTATFDIDMPYSSNEGTVYADFYLKDSSGTTVDSSFPSYYITGFQADSFTITLGSVPSSGSHYIYAEIYPPGYATTDTWTSSSFQLYSLDPISVNFFSFSWERADTDGDGYYDSVTATFDPDFESSSDSGYIDVVINFEDSSATMVDTFSSQYYINGVDVDNFQVTFDGVPYVDYFYFDASVAPSGGSTTDTYYSTQVALAPLGYGFPYFFSISETSTDQDGDAYTDSVEFQYDIDYNNGLEDTVEIVFETYLSGSLVNTYTTTELVTGTNADSFTYTVEVLSESDVFDQIDVMIRTQGLSTWADSRSYFDFDMYPPGASDPYIHDVTVTTSSSYGGSDDLVDVSVDPNVYAEQNVFVQGYLYDSNDNEVQFDETGIITIYGSNVDSFELSFHSVTESGTYYVVVHLFIDGATDPSDTWTSNTFELTAEGSDNGGSTDPTDDPTDDSDDGDGPTADLPFSSIAYIVLGLFTVSVIAKRRHFK